MTYATGQIINASDYVGFRGNQGPGSPYASSLVATNKLAALVGVGFATRGYGQTSFSMPPVATGDVITAAQWNGIISAMSLINTHTGTGLSLPASVSAGSSIVAFDGTSSRPDIASQIASLDTARLSFDVGQMSLTSAASSARTTPWTTSVTHEFTATFASEDEARYFFNSGGNIYASASRTGGSTSTINSSMSTILSNMGTVRFGAETTTYTGSGGTVYPIGYYDLTTGYQTLFYITNGAYGYSYGYSNVSYTLRARTENVFSENGGNGSIVRFQAVFAETAASYVSIDGTLTSSISQLKAAGALAVASPTYSTTVPL